MKTKLELHEIETLSCIVRNTIHRDPLSPYAGTYKRILDKLIKMFDEEYNETTKI